jgi:hypothetical protein
MSTGVSLEGTNFSFLAALYKNGISAGVGKEVSRHGNGDDDFFVNIFFFLSIFFAWVALLLCISTLSCLWTWSYLLFFYRGEGVVRHPDDTRESK